MKVVHLVAADRWTGAAATALQAVEALREMGIDARFVFRPGRGLATRLAEERWALPDLVKERSPSGLRAAVRRVRDLIGDADVVHAHLPHDHLLARLAGRRGRRPLVRSIHHPGHLRPDPYHRWLFRFTAGLGLANSDMQAASSRVPALRGIPSAVLPIALEARFAPGGDRAGVRQRLGIPATATVIGTIGKLDPSRGQDRFVRALSAVTGVWGLIVGKGPFEPALRSLAAELGVADRLAFAGYVEDGLEHCYAAMDLFVFPAAGSDWAHRAIAEAGACGLPSLAADLPGVRDLVEPGVAGDIYPINDDGRLAHLMRDWTADPGRLADASRTVSERMRRECAPARLAAACRELYRRVMAGTPAPS